MECAFPLEAIHEILQINQRPLLKNGIPQTSEVKVRSINRDFQIRAEFQTTDMITGRHCLYHRERTETLLRKQRQQHILHESAGFGLVSSS